ncbi:DoxX family protein, partial [Acinetobacter baumannii]
FDTTIKLIKIEPVVTALAELGYPDSVARPIGLIVLVCAVLYAMPKTSILGAVLLTGLLGGAIASHVRIDSPLFSHTFFGVYL